MPSTSFMSLATILSRRLGPKWRGWSCMFRSRTMWKNIFDWWESSKTCSTNYNKVEQKGLTKKLWFFFSWRLIQSKILINSNKIMSKEVLELICWYFKDPDISSYGEISNTHFKSHYPKYPNRGRFQASHKSRHSKLPIAKGNFLS